MLINVNILCFINIGIPCKHLFGSFTASAIKSQHRTFFNINKNSQQIIFYDLRCESLFRMYEFLWNTWLIFSSVTVQYLTVTRKNPFQIGCADRIFAFYSKFSYGQRSKCADLLNSYYLSTIALNPCPVKEYTRDYVTGSAPFTGIFLIASKFQADLQRLVHPA